MRVFVLSTGRCGSTTFVKACEHVTNFSAGHETRAGETRLDARLDYPDRHIEADNRLAWFLPSLAQRYPDAFYVHLTRDRQQVVDSFTRRWGIGRSNITQALGTGILIQDRGYNDRRKREVCTMYVDVVTETISDFLRDRDHMSVAVDTADTDFAKFLDRIGAEGNLEAAIAEWRMRYNAS